MVTGGIDSGDEISADNTGIETKSGDERIKDLRRRRDDIAEVLL